MRRASFIHEGMVFRKAASIGRGKFGDGAL
jgi:hypothetical protein